MPDKPVHYKRLSSELSRLLAFALQLAGVPRQTSYHGDLDQLLLEEPVAAALDEEDRRLVVLAWMLLVADEEGQTPKGLENGGMARLAQRIGELLSISTGKLLDATPLSRIARLSTLKVFPAEATLAQGLAYLREHGFSYLVYQPVKGEMGFVSHADIGAWLSRAVEKDPYGLPPLDTVCLDRVFGIAPRAWRIVDASLTVGELRERFEQPDKRLDAVLVRGTSATAPAGIVTASDFDRWRKPSHPMRDQAAGLLASWRGKRNQARRHGGAVEVQEAMDRLFSRSELTALLSMDQVEAEPLASDPEQASSAAEALCDLLAVAGYQGVAPRTLFDALRGRATREVLDLRLDTRIAFGRGVLLTASFTGQVLQALADAGLVENAAPGRVRKAAAWQADTDLDWLDERRLGAEAAAQEAEPGLGKEPPVDSAPMPAEAAPDPGAGAVSGGEPAPEAMPGGGPGSGAGPESAPVAKPQSEPEPKPAPAPNPALEPKVAPAPKLKPKHEPAPKPAPAQPRKPLPPLKPLPYRPYEGKRQSGNFFKAPNLLSLTLAVIRFEGPIASSLLMRRVAGLWGVPKVTPKVRDRFAEVLPQTGSRGGMKAKQFGGELFYMTAEQERRPQVRTNQGATSGRSSAEIPLEEIRVVVEHELASGPLPKAKLADAVCAAFGLDASKQAPRKMAVKAVDTLVERGKLKASGKNVELS